MVYHVGTATRSLASSILVEWPAPSPVHQTGATSMAPHFTCQRIRSAGDAGTRTLFIEPGSLWENGYIESASGKLRDGRLNREGFCILDQAQVPVRPWRQECNHRRLHSALGNSPPAPKVYLVPNLRSPLTAAAAFGLT
jgi:transposase InsO family protein